MVVDPMTKNSRQLRLTEVRFEILGSVHVRSLPFQKYYVCFREISEVFTTLKPDFRHFFSPKPFPDASTTQFLAKNFVPNHDLCNKFRKNARISSQTALRLGQIQHKKHINYTRNKPDLLKSRLFPLILKPCAFTTYHQTP